MVHRHLRGLIDAIDHCLLSRRAGRCGLVGVVESARRSRRRSSSGRGHLARSGRRTRYASAQRRHRVLPVEAPRADCTGRTIRRGEMATTHERSGRDHGGNIRRGHADGRHRGRRRSDQLHTLRHEALARIAGPARQRRCLPWRACRRDAPDGILHWPSLGARRSFGLRALVPRYHPRTFDDRIRADRGRRDRRRVIHRTRRPSPRRARGGGSHDRSSTLAPVGRICRWATRGRNARSGRGT